MYSSFHFERLLISMTSRNLHFKSISTILNLLRSFISNISDSSLNKKRLWLIEYYLWSSETDHHESIRFNSWQWSCFKIVNRMMIWISIEYRDFYNVIRSWLSCLVKHWIKSVLLRIMKSWSMTDLIYILRFLKTMIYNLQTFTTWMKKTLSWK